MTPDSASAGDDYGDDGRSESEAERLDRNWNELLQELRVLQTGTQILTGFLLTVAFQSRFEDLDEFQVDVYLVLVVLASLTTALGLAPVSLHRWLFRKRAKDAIVRIGHGFLQAALVGIALTISGVSLLIFDVVWTRTAGVVTAVGTLVAILVFWVVVPSLAGRRR
ncbi:DUF6328 family protein [Microbacteriaceae bacterium 4G12]